MKKGNKIIYFEKLNCLFIGKVSGSFYIKNRVGGFCFWFFFVVVLVLEYNQMTINIQVISKWFFQSCRDFFFFF